MKRIPLTQGKFALVDDEDYDYLSKFKWCYVDTGGVGGYVSVFKHGVRIYMHRLVNKTPKGKCTDHINGNKLDNRKSNLRTCTRLGNNRNVGSKGSSSGYKGVCFFKRDKTWRTQITVNYKAVHICYSGSPEEGALIYNEIALRCFGEFAYLNGVSRKSRIKFKQIVKERLESILPRLDSLGLPNVVLLR